MALTANTFREALRLANAAGLDAGNRSAKRVGRADWSGDDYDAACDTIETVLCALGYAESWQRAA